MIGNTGGKKMKILRGCLRYDDETGKAQELDAN